MPTISFLRLIGHEKLAKALGAMFEKGTYAHAFLFYGPQGIGKTTVIEECLRSLIGPTFKSHPDVSFVKRETDPKTEKKKTAISVEQIRDLRERLSMSPLGGSLQVAVIDEADRLNASAANALLKHLEEPAKGTILFLRATNLEQVMPTIRSRCQLFALRAVSRDTILQSLVRRGIAPSDARAAAAISYGRPGYAIRFIEDSAFRADRETASATFLTLLSTTLPGRLKVIADLIPKKDTDSRSTAERLLHLWEGVLRDLLLSSLDRSDLFSDVSSQEALKAAGRERASGEWLQLLHRLRESREALKDNGNPLLALEHVWIEV